MDPYDSRPGTGSLAYAKIQKACASQNKKRAEQPSQPSAGSQVRLLECCWDAITYTFNPFCVQSSITIEAVFQQQQHRLRRGSVTLGVWNADTHMGILETHI